MKPVYRNFFLMAGLVTVLSCQSVDPIFDTEQRYKHDLFSSEAECRQRLGSNPEFSCSETVAFGADGRAVLLLGGGDMSFASLYERKSKIITIEAAPGLPNRIEFTVVSDTELVRVDNGTRWKRY